MGVSTYIMPIVKRILEKTESGPQRPALLYGFFDLGGQMSKRKDIEAKTEELVMPLIDEKGFEFVDTDYFRNQYKTIDKKFQKRIKLSPEKAAEKIVKRILKQKVRGVIGRDAKRMDRLSRLFPALSVKWYEIKVKHSKAKLFENLK